jgi:diaminohydroxyphosphoribosylaminopyrimidine deaminase/5-amino-6-(5-phosphoribosylamino)uracil reductase
MEVDHPLLTARHGDVMATLQPQRWVFARRELSYCTPGVSVTSESPQEFLDRMGAAGVLGVLIEGGPTLLASFVGSDLVDELFVYVAPMVFGDQDAKDAFSLPTGRLLVDPLRLSLLDAQAVGTDIELRFWSVKATTLASQFAVELDHGSELGSEWRAVEQPSPPGNPGTMSHSESN